MSDVRIKPEWDNPDRRAFIEYARSTDPDYDQALRDVSQRIADEIDIKGLDVVMKKVPTLAEIQQALRADYMSLGNLRGGASLRVLERLESLLQSGDVALLPPRGPGRPQKDKQTDGQ